MAPQKLFYISIFLLVCSSKADNPEAEALLRWKSSLVRANSLSSWSISSSTCSWFGVTCDAAGHVTELHLPSVRLHGTLHVFYSAAFQNLSVLDLHNNHLVGVIPANISLFLTLTVLDLSYNNLVGGIPYQLSKLPVIVELDLGNNHLTNHEYTKFSPMFSLKLLSLENNDLSGTFPQFIVNCSNVRMRSLDLSGNAFSGSLPASLPEMVPRLRYLNLSANGFCGLIPRSLSRLQKLEILCLNINNLTGGIPEELGMISGLRKLLLGSNSLGGSIPASLGQLQLLETLGIRNASLVSTLPSELGNLTSIRNMYLSRNWLLGSLPPSFARMQELRQFGVKENSIGGTIPQEMFANWSKIRSVDLSDNPHPSPCLLLRLRRSPPPGSPVRFCGLLLQTTTRKTKRSWPPQSPLPASTLPTPSTVQRLVLWASTAVDDKEDTDEDEEELAPKTPPPAPTPPAPSAAPQPPSPPRDERPWLDISRQRRPRHAGHPGHGNSATALPAPRDRIGQKQASLLRFIRKTKGKCSKCLAPSHRAAKCGDEMRCLSCDESGHRERFCPRRRKLKPPTCPAACSGTPARATSSPRVTCARSWAEIVADPLPRQGRDVCEVDVAGDLGRQHAASPPPTLPVDHADVTVVGLRLTFVKQARLLRDDLNTALDKALQPLKEDAAALCSWLARASSFLEHAEELVSKLDFASSVLARSLLPCSPVEGPPPHVAMEPPSGTVGRVVVLGMRPLHGGGETCNEDMPTAADASPTFTSVTPSSSPSSPVGPRCQLHLSHDSPYLVCDISTEFEAAPLGMPMPVTSPLPPKKSKGALLASPRRSGRIAQQKKKLSIFKSKGASKKKKPSSTVKIIPHG